MLEKKKVITVSLVGVLLAGGIGGALHLVCIRRIKLPVRSRLMRCAIQDNILIRYMGEQNVPGSFFGCIIDRNDTERYAMVKKSCRISR